MSAPWREAAERVREAMRRSEKHAEFSHHGVGTARVAIADLHAILATLTEEPAPTPDADGGEARQ